MEVTPMADAPDEPGPVPLFDERTITLTPQEATAALAKIQADMHPAPELKPTDAVGARLLLDKLTADQSWAKALMRGDPQTSKQFADLTALSAAGDTAADAAVGIAEPSQLVEYTVNGELNRRDTAAAVQHFQEIGIGNDAILQGMHGGRVSSKEHAAATAILAARRNDPEWTAALLAGGYEQRREMTLLNIILSSEIEFG
jgi:hypothetical protein